MMILELAVLVFVLMIVGLVMTAQEFNGMFNDDDDDDDNKNSG